MNYTFLVLDDDALSIQRIKDISSQYPALSFIDSAENYTDAINLILKHTPHFIFLEIDPMDKSCGLSLSIISELLMYLKKLPKIIITTKNKDFGFDAIQYNVSGYILKPLNEIDFVKLLHKFDQENVVNVDEEVLFLQNVKHKGRQIKTPIQDKVIRRAFILCVKSYGDYRYIDSNEICYFKADNNSTDIHLKNGEMVTAFKTLKHFESVLCNPFIRIHNSYIVNRNYISRIHTGNSLCYIKKTAIKLPFSKTYKANIDFIIKEFANENYIET